MRVGKYVPPCVWRVGKEYCWKIILFLFGHKSCCQHCGVGTEVLVIAERVFFLFIYLGFHAC